MSNSISVISTQMQLINCIETIKNKGCETNDLIVYIASKGRYEQINELLKTDYCQSVFNNIIVVNLYSKNRAILFYNLLKFKKTLVLWLKKRTYDFCISGNYGYNFHMYFMYLVGLHNLRVEYILVDDGAAMINIAYRRMREIQDDTPKRHLSNIEKFFFDIEGYLTFVPSKLTYYSVYDIETTNDDILVKQNYNYLKSYNNKDINISDDRNIDVIFLGQPLIEGNILTYEQYNRYLQAIANYYCDKKLMYVYHPIESSTSLDYNNRKRYQTVRSKFSFEILATSVPENTKIISFYTSTLPNLVYMGFNFQIISVYLNEINNLDSEKRRNIQRVYDNFSNISGLSVLNI